jgi:hypothetical protein
MLSFSVGVYDLFSYTIPGILYLFVANEVIRTLGFPYLKYQDVTSPAAIVLVVCAAFILGHVMDFVADRWKELGEKKKVSTQAVEILKRNYPDLDIKFQPKERAVLFAVIRRTHNDITATLDRNKAISILFQNVSLGLLLSAIYFLINMFANGYSSISLALLIVSTVLSLVIRQRSRMFNLWFNSLIFEVALTYGTNTQDILKSTKLKKMSENDRS